MLLAHTPSPNGAHSAATDPAPPAPSLRTEQARGAHRREAERRRPGMVEVRVESRGWKARGERAEGGAADDAVDRRRAGRGTGRRAWPRAVWPMLGPRPAGRSAACTPVGSNNGRGRRRSSATGRWPRWSAPAKTACLVLTGNVTFNLPSTAPWPSRCQ